MEIPTNIIANYMEYKMLFIQNLLSLNNFSDKNFFIFVPLTIRSNKISNFKSVSVDQSVA
jgi:hypothetical protein